MTSERFAKLKGILLTAAKLPPAARDDYLDQACGDDRKLRDEAVSLLAHAEDVPAIVRTAGMGGLLNRSVRARFLQEPEPSFPERIGPYRILNILGEGGMGVVYLAEQTEPIQRQVALKLVRWGLDSQQVVARFEMERQTLALMDHPHIAKVLDAGSDEQGRPFFVMELVRGTPITAYCDAHDIPIPERLQLLLAVCKAIQHAHQKGIIHRDLKPSNLLVALQDGVPTVKVIDFGIAKLLEDSATANANLTREGQPLGTISYMSPEQARGETARIDTRSDVYSLGTIMYELLTGASPYRETGASLLEQIRIICQERPRPFAEIFRKGQRPDGDLETIVAKALAKDPEDRYQSMASLAEDIERYLASQPILARPPSAAYQLRKLIARNRIPATLIAGIVLLIVGFGVWMSFLYTRSEANYRRAVQAEGEAGQVSDFMIDIFNISDPDEARGNTITAREILDQGAARIERDLVEQPEVQARIMHTMGVVYRGLGSYDRAESLLEAALQRREDITGQRSLAWADVLTDLAHVHQAQGKYEEAVTSYQLALGVQEELLGPSDRLVASTLTSLALVYNRLARSQEAEGLLHRSVSILEKAGDNGSAGLIDALSNLAQVEQDQGRYTEAESLFLRCQAIRQYLFEPDHPDIARGLNNLSSFYWMLGKLDEAESLATQSVQTYEKVLGPDHPELARALMNLAALYEERQAPARALPLLNRALPIQEKALGPDHPDVAVALNNLGRIYRHLERFTESEQALERSLLIRQTALGPDHPKVSNALISLAELHLDQDRFDAADSLLHQALAIRETAYGPADPRTALPLHDLGLLRMRQERYAEAEPFLFRSLAIRDSTLGPDHYRIAESLETCATLQCMLRRYDLADTLQARAARMRGRLH